MEPGHASTADEFKASASDHDGEGLYLRGLIDEIGDRVLVLDEQRTATLEVLRFRQTLTASPGFEVALRRRVERLRHFHHPAFAETPTVEYVGRDRYLALVSNHTPECRLSDLLACGYAQDPVLASSLLHQLIPALTALNEFGEGVGHGALTASRIVIAPDGQPIIIEHVLGPAVERLHLTAAASRRDLGIAMPAIDTYDPAFHGQTDCFQLALVAVSMLLGRSLIEDEYSDLSGTLNAALSACDHESVEAISGLRTWLERALQLERGFLTLGEASAALRNVAIPDPDVIALRWRALQEAFERSANDPPPFNDLWEFPLEPPADVPREVDVPVEPVDSPPFDFAEATQPKREPLPVAVPFFSKAYGHVQATHGYIRWALVGLALCALLEAVVIARLLAGRGSMPPAASVAQVNLVTNEPGAPVLVDGRLAGVTPLDLSIKSEMRSITVGTALTLAPKPEMIVGSSGLDTNPLAIGRDRVAAEPRSRTDPAPAARASGGIRVSSPIELDVFEGDKRLGSTATGIVPAPAGRHEVDLINSVLGFRSRQVVEVKAGQVVSLTVSAPNGRININAVPWAEVLIDGKSIGETPIGNLSIPLGEHEIVFRHPQLGEVRRTAVVRSDAVTRVSANLER